WLGSVFLRKGFGMPKAPAAEIGGQWRLLSALFLLWIVLFVAVLAGAPLHRGGWAAIAACWVVYLAPNVLLAWFLLRFTSIYALIPSGELADRTFMRFLGIVVSQPLMTAAAFTVLNQVMGLTWNLQVPALPAIQEGI